MKDYIDQLVRSLLQKQSLEECSLQELKELASDHPYFGAAQLLLAKKLQKERSAEYSAQVEKTSLFFNNPLWLDQLLNDKGGSVVEVKDKLEVKEDVNSTNGKPEEAIVKEVRIPPEEIESKSQPEPQPQPEPEFQLESESQSEQVNISTQPQPKTQPEFQPESESQLLQVNTPTNPQPKPLFRKEDSFKSTDFVFEPYHTVDYFASQGIRFKEEEKPTDKFGQQLKSFTEWLKTLKRLPVSEIVKHSSPATEQKVEQMAEASLTEGEVVTEAMAEVWAKQGNTEKAISIYEKLSLLEPAKSVYFAAKIEDLKR